MPIISWTSFNYNIKFNKFVIGNDVINTTELAIQHNNPLLMELIVDWDGWHTVTNVKLLAAILVISGTSKMMLPIINQFTPQTACLLQKDELAHAEAKSVKN